jgi:hypothetical protein
MLVQGPTTDWQDQQTAGRHNALRCFTFNYAFVLDESACRCSTDSLQKTISLLLLGRWAPAYLTGMNSALNQLLPFLALGHRVLVLRGAWPRDWRCFGRGSGSAAPWSR